MRSTPCFVRHSPYLKISAWRSSDPTNYHQPVELSLWNRSSAASQAGRRPTSQRKISRICGYDKILAGHVPEADRKFWNTYSLKTTQKKYADIDGSARAQEAESRTSSASKNIRRIWGMCRREGKAGERGSHHEADCLYPCTYSITVTTREAINSNLMKIKSLNLLYFIPKTSRTFQVQYFRECHLAGQLEILSKLSAC
jgi:hypothetical protein